MDKEIEKLADYLTDAFFALGSEPDSEAHRVQYMGGEYPDYETPQGGMNRIAFRNFLIDRLQGKATYDTRTHVVVPIEWFKAARCGDYSDGHETIYPCQWCDEKRAMLAAAQESEETTNAGEDL